MNAKEIGKWVSHDECDMLVEETQILRDPKSGKEVGKSSRSVEIKATIEDLIGGIQVKEEEKKNILNSISNAEASIAALGKVPAMNSEMIKLQRNLEAIQKNQQKAQHVKKLEEAKASLLEIEEFLKNRQSIIDARPPAPETVLKEAMDETEKAEEIVKEVDEDEATHI